MTRAALLIAALMLVGCDSASAVETSRLGSQVPVTTNEASPAVTQSPSLFPGKDLHIGAADLHKVFLVRAGTTIDVVLDANPAARPRQVWSAPESADVQIVSDVSRSTDSSGSATAAFRAAAPGTTTIGAVQMYYCGNQPCAQDSMWTVTIEVEQL